MCQTVTSSKADIPEEDNFFANRGDCVTMYFQFE